MSETKSGKPIHEGWLLAVLAIIQFTAVVDFMIIMPLGPNFIRTFHISTEQFGNIVAAYAIAAGVAGFLAAFFIDRFDRKKALLGLYIGFTVGTLFCAVAPTYGALVAARAVAGAFGGVTMGMVMAIVGDVIPEIRRGKAMGIVMSSFSVASIFGVPVGLYLAKTLNSWHVPFYTLAALCALVVPLIHIAMPPLRGHIDRIAKQPPAKMIATIVRDPKNLRAFAFMAMLMCTGFTIFPFLATYLVHNVGLTEGQLPWVYASGGVCTLVSLNLIGRWADRAGKKRVFTIMMLVSMIPVVVVTNLPHVALSLALLVSTVFMVCSSGRTVPAMALLTASVEAHERGGFMSINSSVQQISMGFAVWLSGQIVQDAGEHMFHFGVSGLVSIFFGLLAIYLVQPLKPVASAASEPALMET